jgi:predicted ATPase
MTPIPRHGTSHHSAQRLLALLGDGRDLEPLKRVIIEKTEGNPFFMEETVQVLLDEGALVRDGDTVKLTRPVSELKIPSLPSGSSRNWV